MPERVIHYVLPFGHGTGLACMQRDSTIAEVLKGTEARMWQRSTTVKADATCRRCIRYFRNSATPEQIARLTGRSGVSTEPEGQQ